MEKRELLLDSLDGLLEELRETERALASRATGLVSATTIAITLMLGLRQNQLPVPVWLLTLYAVLAVVSAISILGRQLDHPAVGQDWRSFWMDLNDDQVQERLFDAKKMAARANLERLHVVRIAFAIHALLVGATVIASLLYVGSKV